MYKISLTEAKSRLAELVKEAASGEEIIITQQNGSAVKLVPLASDKPVPEFGSARGLVVMSDDFDEPLDDLKDFSQLSSSSP